MNISRRDISLVLRFVAASDGVVLRSEVGLIDELLGQWGCKSNRALEEPLEVVLSGLHCQGPCRRRGLFVFASAMGVTLADHRMAAIEREVLARIADELELSPADQHRLYRDLVNGIPLRCLTPIESVKRLADAVKRIARREP